MILKEKNIYNNNYINLKIICKINNFDYYIKIIIKFFEFLRINLSNLI